MLKFNNSITLDDLRMFVKNNTGKFDIKCSSCLTEWDV